MAVIGIDLDSDELVLQKGRDFKWSFRSLNADREPLNFPPGTLYFEFATEPAILWEFEIEDNVASLKVESTEVDDIPSRTRWQLVFRNDGEAVGGDPVARGIVRVQE